MSLRSRLDRLSRESSPQGAVLAFTEADVAEATAKGQRCIATFAIGQPPTRWDIERRDATEAEWSEWAGATR